MTDVAKEQPSRMGPRGPANTDISLDRMDHGKLFVYGVGMFSTTISLLFPLSVIKTKQMATPNVSPGFDGARQIARQIYKNDGIFGFYRGYSTILTGAIPTRMIYLPTYEIARTACNKTLEGLNDSLELSHTLRASLANGVGGATASLASASIAVPIDVVSSRLMVLERGGSAAGVPAGAADPGRTRGNLQTPAASTSLRQAEAALAAGPGGRPGAAPIGAKAGPGPGSVRGYASAAGQHVNFNGFTMARHILRTEGLGGLYRGIGMSVLTYTPSSAMWWGSYAVYLDLVWGALYRAGADVRNDDAWSITAVQALCGTMAGCTASILTTPLDVVKTQLQVAGRDRETAHLGTWKMVQKVYAAEGFGGFWRGAIPRVVNVSLWGTAMVTTYEVLKRLCVKDD